MRRVIDPLERMGGHVEADDGRPPLRIRGRPLEGIAYAPPVASAQVKSAVLLAGLHAGGTTRGLIDAGGYVIAGLDKQESCRRTYVANNGNETGDGEHPEFLALDLFPATPDYPGGRQGEAIERLDTLIRAHAGRHADVPLVFAICAPCQPFSKLGKTELGEERRAALLRDQGLLAHACTFVERYRPDMVLSENVSGISDPRYGGVWEDFENRLRDLSFAVSTKCVCASDFGIPQYRKRTILAAIPIGVGRTFEPFDLPGSDPSADRMTVSEALSGLPPIDAGEKHGELPNHAARGLSELNRKRISHAKPGESNECLSSTPDGDLSLACHRRVNARFRDRCFGDVYTRMAPDRPSPTITTHCHSITNGRFGHPDTGQIRGISMREAARLQSFRDDYVFHPVDRVEPIARMIGNAVPPTLACFYARHLVEELWPKR